ncbi:MAG TPA: tetratricopeptide repeat-containing diguanylate cyclase [Casimicrobiaceae bacterium]
MTSAAPRPASTPSHDRLAALLAESTTALAHDARDAARLAAEATKLATLVSDTGARARARYLEGRAAELALDEPGALEAYRESLALFQAVHDDVGRADALRGIGQVYDTLGDAPQALAHHLRALALAEDARDVPAQAAAMRTIGIVHSRAGRPDVGLDWYQKSLALRGVHGDPLERARTLNNIGINLKNLGRLDESLSTLHSALAAFQSAGATLGQAGALNNLGATLDKMDRLDEAETTLRDALERSTASGYGEGVVNASLGLGRVCDRTARAVEARMHLETALDVAQHAQLRGYEVEAHDALADLHERSGNSADAVYHLRASREIERALMSEASDRRLKMLSVRYQVTAAQRETDLMRAKQDELAKANARLAALNLELAASDAQKSRLVVELERQTREDSLTGLANRRRLDQRLHDEFNRAVRYGRPLAVAIADLDHFKDVNDRWTHAVGDAVLKRVASVLSAEVRHTDLVARYGGEEFVLVLVETGAEAAAAVCEKVRTAIAMHDFTGIAPGLAITVSIGWSADTSLPGPESMLGAADTALYRAKAAGRNRTAGGKASG